MPELQAVRIDGQGLQTLYCNSDGLRGLSVSPDSHWVAFTGPTQYPGAANTLHLLDTTTGKLLPGVDIPAQDSTVEFHNPVPSLWLSNTQVYLTDVSGSVPFNTYLFDIDKGEHQALSSLPIVSHQMYSNEETDGTSLFLNAVQCPTRSKNDCTLDQATTMITRQPVQGGTAQTVFQDAQLRIYDLHMLDSRTLLVLTGKPSENTLELWKVKSDGSSKTRLTSIATTADQSKQGVPAHSLFVSPDSSQVIARYWPGAPGNAATQPCLGSPESGQMTPLPITGTSTRIVGWIQI
jgi:hypothetical protein